MDVERWIQRFERLRRTELRCIIFVSRLVESEKGEDKEIRGSVKK